LLQVGTSSLLIIKIPSLLRCSPPSSLRSTTNYVYKHDVWCRHF